MTIPKSIVAWLSPESTYQRNVLLRIAAAVMLGGQLAWFVMHPGLFGAAVLLAVGILTWLLLQGNRIVWSLAVLSGAMQVAGPLLFGQPVWFAVSGAILLVCLLHPSPRALVWAERLRGSHASAASD
jgi:hypothetical protein